MDRKKIIYVGGLFLLTIIVCAIDISYSFFTIKNEQHGKLNMTVGTLDYKISSSDLNNNSVISLSSKEIKTIQIRISSLNSIRSNYRLYYLSTGDDVEVFYDTNYDSANGIIDGLSDKILNLKLVNHSSTNASITFKIEGGLINNQLASGLGKSIEALQPLIITFNANGGTVSEQSRDAFYHAIYTNLPAPTRTGYNFKGWKGSNIAPAIQSGNYNYWHFQDRTSHELKTENNVPYIRINGYSSYADTAWYISSVKSIPLTPSTDYTISFDARTNSNNATISRYDTTVGYTGLYNSGVCVAPTLESVTFNNDGEWFRYHQVITTNSTVSTGYIRIGNDIPNLYGDNIYFDIANIKLEKGATLGEWEPTYITNNTKIVNTNSHELTAEWEEKTYTVKFNANGGSGNMVDQNFTYNETKALTANSFTRTGYTFKGWATTPVTTQENIISLVEIGRNFTQNGNDFICDQIAEQVDSYLRITLSNSLVTGDKYVFIYEAEDVPTPTTLSFGYPTQRENSKKVKNGVNVVSFTAASNTTSTIFDDTSKDANARVTFRNFRLYKTNDQFGNMYKDAELVQGLLDSGTLNLYAVWEKN